MTKIAFALILIMVICKAIFYALHSGLQTLGFAHILRHSKQQHLAPFEKSLTVKNHATSVPW